MSTFEDVLFESSLNRKWHMLPGERAALIYLLQRLRPQISIEIGTFQGGSLRPISAYSERVYTFDIDVNQHRVAPLFPNVTFVTGDTGSTLRPIIDKLNAGAEDVGFMLVDGSHEEDGVFDDVSNCLSYIPKRGPCVILVHDSCNPAVRMGIQRAPFEACPYVHGVDLDFVPGALYDRSDIRNQMWGGLAVVVMLPERRSGRIELNAGFEYSRLALLEKSIYR